MRTVPPPGDGYLRIAVVQLDYLPAIEDALEDPLWTRSGAPHSLRPVGGVWPSHLQPKYEALRKQVRSIYVEALQTRLVDILRICVERKVAVVIFPEYSVPPECLKSLAEGFPELVIVAGSHHVTGPAIEAGTYTDLDANAKPRLNTNVAPVLSGGKMVATVSKRSLTAEEENVHDIEPGEAWDPVELTSVPDATTSVSVEPFGVLLCKDFIHQHSDLWHKSVFDAQERFTWLAVPALTPAHSTSELGEFAAHAREQSKRYQRPVALANHAAGGGTFVYRDHSGHASAATGEPLPPGFEGVSIVDVDMAQGLKGSSNTYGVRSATKVVGWGPIVYPVVEPEHARWLAEFRALLTNQGDEAVSVIRDWLTANPPLVLEHEATRRRGNTVAQEKARWYKVARFEREFGDVVLGRKALPMNLLRAAIAEGAAREVESWHQPFASGACVDAPRVAQSLSDGAARLTSSASVTVEVRAAMDDVSVRVASGPSREPTAFVRLSWLSDKSTEEVQACKLAFERGDFEGASAKARELADALSGDQHPTPELEERRSQARLIATAALANLGNTDEAKRELQQVKFDGLSRERQIDFVTLSVVLGELDEAESLLVRVNPETEAETKKWRGAQQSLDFSRGRPVDFQQIEQPSVRLRIAALTLERGDFPKALEVMKPLLSHDATPLPEDNSAVVFLWTTELTCTALLASAMPERIPWVSNPIPLPSEARVELVAHLEKAFERARQLEPSNASSRLAAFEEQFRRGTMDWDWLAKHVLSNEELEDQRRTDAVLSAGRRGDLGGARQLLESVVPEWRRRLLFGELLRQIGDLAEAEKLLEELRREFPGRPDVETAFALVAMDREKPDEAIEALRAARDALPGVGQRLQLAKALFEVGNADEALDELAPLADDRRPTVALALARIHDGLGHVAKAVQGYQSYLVGATDATVQVRLAILLLGRGEVEHALATSWAAFQTDRARLNVPDLRRIAAVQQRSVHKEERGERITAILSELDGRSVDSPEAASAHAELKLQSEGPSALSATEVAELEKAGVISTFDIADLVQHVERRSSQIEDVVKWQRLGQLGLATALRFTGETNAQYLERAFHAAESVEKPGAEGFWFSPPVTLLPTEPLRLEGIEVLVGALELTLLVKLELVEPLRLALGSSGRLIMPSEEWMQLVAEADRELAVVQTDALVRLADELREDVDQEQPGLRLQGGAWVELPGRSVLRWLSREGLVSRPPGDQNSTDEVDSTEAETALPHRSQVNAVVLDLGTAQRLKDRGELRAIVDIVRLTKGTASQARAAQRQHENLQAASALAKRSVVLTARAEQEGWLQFVAFEQHDIPPPKTKANCPAVFADDAAHAMRFATLALKTETRRRIAVDNRLRRLSIDPRVLTYWDWPRAEYLRSLERLHSAAARDISLSHLMRELSNDSESRKVLLGQLLSLGFVDALDAAGVVEIHGRYLTAGGVNSPVGRVQLNGFEQVAACVKHAHRYEASQIVAVTYAAAIFSVWCEAAKAEQTVSAVGSQRAFTEVLLDRLDSLDLSGLSTLETAVNAIIQMILIGPTTSWINSRDQTADSRSNGPVIMLVRQLLSLCTTLQRAGALGRALTRAWLELDRAMSGRENVRVGGLWELTLAAIGADGAKQETPSSRQHRFPVVIDVLSVLSSLWPPERRPLKAVATDASNWNVEDVLRQGADALEDPVGTGLKATLTSISIPGSLFEGSKRYVAPAEALLLRAKPEVAAGLTEQLMSLQGIHDGEAYALLRSFAEDPSSDERRAALARHAVQSTWRRTIEDPLYLMRWRGNLEFLGAASSPAEAVSRLLSEPLTWMPEGAGIAEHFTQRFADGGAWADRIDKYELVGVLGPPGWFAAYQARQRFLGEGDDLDEQVVFAWKRLHNPDEQSVAELCRDVVFLRLAVGQRSEFTWDGTTVNLAEHLPTALTNLLRSLDSKASRVSHPARRQEFLQTERKDPGEDSLARHEAALLRWCRGALFGPTGFAPCNQTTILWLTWRFYGWLVNQLRLFRDRRGSQAYFEAVARLAEAAPLKGEMVDDVLDPTCFDADGSHRLVATVHALGVGAIAERIDGNVPPAMPSTASLVSHLCELAERATPAGPKGDCLDWRAPHNLPDLAVWVLLTFDEHNLLKLTQHTRLRLLSRLSVAQTEIAPGALDLIQRVFVAYSVCASELEPEERRKVRARAMEADSTELYRVQTGLLSALFAAGEADLRSLAEERFYMSAVMPSESERSHILAVSLLRGESPDTFVSRVAELRQGLKERGVTEEFVLDALGNLVAHGEAEHSAMARTLLRDFASEPNPSPRLAELLEALGMGVT